MGWIGQNEKRWVCCPVLFVCLAKGRVGRKERQGVNFERGEGEAARGERRTETNRQMSRQTGEQTNRRTDEQMNRQAECDGRGEGSDEMGFWLKAREGARKRRKRSRSRSRGYRSLTTQSHRTHSVQSIRPGPSFPLDAFI